MEDTSVATNSSRYEKKEQNKSFYIPTHRIILCFCLLALGFGFISLSNLLTIHSPSFFYIYGDLNTTIFYAVQTITAPLGYLLIVIALFLLASPLFSFLTSIKPGQISSIYQQEDILAIRAKAEQNPDKVEPIWDLGRANLQEYFNRNLSQISNIYRLSVGAMVAGFAIIAFSILIGIAEGFLISPNKSISFTPTLIGASTGIITEFIGATFLFMYRATVQQASEYMKTLERINRVGMATKILDTMSQQSRELRDKTCAELVKFLFLQDLEEEKITSPSRTRRNATKPTNELDETK